MKKYFVFLFIFMLFGLNAQQSNRFAESEDSGYKSEIFSQQNSQELSPQSNGYTIDCDGDGINDTNDPEECEGVGNPGKIPIDNYIPVLILTAAGIIAYSTYKKKSIN